MWIICQGKGTPANKSGHTGKSYFVETRTFWHTFRSFDRLWTFFILALQVNVCCYSKCSPFPVFVLTFDILLICRPWLLLPGVISPCQIFFRRMSCIMCLVFSSLQLFYVCFRVCIPYFDTVWITVTSEVVSFIYLFFVSNLVEIVQLQMDISSMIFHF